MIRQTLTWRDIGPCPCGYRPPKIDSLEGWSAWYDHLMEAHGVNPAKGTDRE